MTPDERPPEDRLPPTTSRAAGGNIFAHLPPAAIEESVEILLRSASMRIERIVSHGHASPPGFWYDQPEDEWVLVLAGAATVRFADDERPVPLKAGDYLFIPAHRRHRVEWTSDTTPTIWLAVHTTAT